jgi:hypothetical protein
MKIQLNIIERILLMQLFPSIEGNFVLYKLMMALKADLSFSEKEIKEFNIVEKDGHITWKKSENKTFEISDVINEAVCRKLEELDKQGHINEQNGILFEKFNYEKYLKIQNTPSDNKIVPMRTKK